MLWLKVLIYRVFLLNFFINIYFSSFIEMQLTNKIVYI